MKKLLRLRLWLLALMVLGGANFAAVQAEEHTDVLTAGLFAATTTTYTDFSGVQVTGGSSAVYAGNSAKTSNGGIQLRSKNSNSGIVSTASGGDRIKSVSITVESGSNTVDVYGSNTAYTAASQLYSSSTQGTKLGSLSASGTITVTGDYKYIGIRSNNGALYLKSITIVWETAGGTVKTPIATLNGFTPTTVKLGDMDEFTLDATFASTDASDYEVVWTSDNTDVLDVAGNTDGNALYEAKAIGTANVTVRVEPVDDATYSAVSETYTVRVIDPSANDGSLEHPYTVSEALAAIDADEGVTGVYAKGVVSEIVTPFNAQHGNISYNISADGSTTSDQLLAYRGLGLNGAAFTSADDISVGDQVVIYGNLTKHNTTYEFAQNNYLASITSKQLTEIRLSGNYPTTFVEGAEFSHEGIEVTAYFDDGSIEDATAKAEFSEPDMTQIGEQQVTVSYTRKGLTATDVYTITIVETPRHNATFSVNGTTTTAQVKEGLAIEFPENPADISCKSFVGWTTTEIATPTDAKPEFVTSATMGTADVTFYAVFAEKTGGSAPALTKLGSDYTFTEGDNLVIVATSDDTEYGLYQETVSNSYVKNFEFDGDVETVTADEKNYFTVAKAPGSTDSWVLGDDTNGYLYSSGSNNLAVTDNVSTWTLDWDDTEGKFTLMTAGRYLSLRDDLSGANQYKWRLGGTSTNSGVPFLDIYKLTGGYSYKGYATNIVPNTYTVTFVNMEYWSWGDDVYIHAFNVNTDSPTGWPGVKCEKTGTIKLFGDTEFPVYNCTFQSAVDPQYVIFNNGDVSGDIKMTLGNAFVDGAAYRTFSEAADQQPKGNFLFTDDANQFKPTEAYNVNYLYGKGGATYARMFTTGKLSTIVLPFAMSEEDAAKRGTFYKITSIKNGKIYGDEVAAPEAYVPYIYMPSDYPWFTDVEVSELPAFALNSVTTDEGYTMEFVAEPTTLTSGGEYDYYGFADGKFVKAAVATANPFRAYIKVPHAANAPATLQWLGDEATGISDYKAEDGSAKKEVFDLQGRRVENPVRGIYIVNGKKAVVK
ncbi:MAG: hypothetical protein J6I34_09975 [Prevotella sp.]|nr:hypothetical protein [Prevotella sp.]